MDGVLSQEEISALMDNPVGAADLDTAPASDEVEEDLSTSEQDAIGEIANISMGTAATTLFSLVNRTVEISTPVVSYSTWDELTNQYERPCVFIRIAYTIGLDGSNILVLKEHDVKVITDLMMGGDGTNTDGELGELHLSAISEAMNQMMGSAATSLSSMLGKKIDISPPSANLVDLTEDIDESVIDEFLSRRFVKISFRMEIGDLVDSEIMQLYPISFARSMCEGVTHTMEMDSASVNVDSAPAPSPTPAAAPQPAPQAAAQPMPAAQPMAQPMGQAVNVQPAQFTAFSNGSFGTYQPENIDLIMDVPLEVTVELGRTSKSISEILDFGPGKIIELNKLAGEPIDVLVNGKNVAKGEVVVIEESFGVRITEIVNAVKAIQT
jgi:flagellar motor switch protein FliN/FliY